MMELEGDGQGGLKPTLAITPPSHERIGESAAILIDDAIEFSACDCRCAYDDGFIVQDVLTSTADGLHEMQVIGIKRLEVVADGNIAETESALDIISYHIDGHTVVFVQFPVMGQHVKLWYP